MAMRGNPTSTPLAPADLRPGDVLLSSTRDWRSWLIRWLDGADFSHAGLYDGAGVIVSGANGIERRGLYVADVFRFHHEGTPLGDGPLDPAILLEQARTYLRAPRLYGYEPLYLVGVLMIMRRLARPAWRRTLVEVFGGILLDRIRRSIDRHFPGGVEAVTGSELVTRIFCDASRAMWERSPDRECPESSRSGDRSHSRRPSDIMRDRSHSRRPSDIMRDRSHSRRPFDIMIELEGRHRWRAWPPTSGRFEHVMQQIEEVLARANPDLPIAASRARSGAPASFGMTVVAGGPLAPACFVSPGDLQHSSSFVHMGRIAPKPPAPGSGRRDQPRLPLETGNRLST